MSRVVNTIEVVNVSQFDGTATFLKDIVFKTSSTSANSFAIREGTQTGNGIGVLPDLAGTTNNIFIFDQLAQILANKTLTNATFTGGQGSNVYLTNPKVNAIYDTNNNIALNIVLSGTSNATSLNVLQTGGTTSSTVLMSATGSSGNIGISIQPKGTGVVSLAGLTFPATLGSSGYALVSNGSSLVFSNISAPTDATFVTTSAATTYQYTLTSAAAFPLNSTIFYNVYLSAVTDVTGDTLGGGFQLKTTYTRDTTSGVHVPGDPSQHDDTLSYVPTGESWSVNTSTSAGNVYLNAIGSSSATVDWKILVSPTIMSGILG